MHIPEGNTPQELQNIIDSGAVHMFGLKNRAHSLEQARRLFTAAADRGYAPAQNIFGALHLIGLSKDDTMHLTAEKYFKIAADQSYPPAQNNLAVVYWNGWGMVNSRKEKAIDLLSIAAREDYAPAQNNLALIQKAENSAEWGGTKALNLLNSSSTVSTEVQKPISSKIMNLLRQAKLGDGGRHVNGQT